MSSRKEAVRSVAAVGQSDLAGAEVAHRPVLLAGLSVASFFTAAVGLSITPFLLNIADDIGSDLTAISILFAWSNLAWAVASLAAGPLSDRLGRKPLLLVGLTFQVAACLGTALALDYPSLLFWRCLTGLGGGTQTPTMMAITTELVPPGQRGRALGWVLTGQSLSLVFGPPSMAVIASQSSWRWAVGSLGVAELIVLVAIARLLPSLRQRRAAGGPSEDRLLLLITRPRVLALYAASALERICYSSVVIFFATYLVTTYELPLQWVGAALVFVALGNVAGTQLGGRLTDRAKSKYLLFAVALAGDGVLALPLLLGAPGVVVSVLLALLYNLANAVGRPPLMWLISDISREARGTVMGLNVTAASVGWLIAGALGGWLVAVHGFAGLALLAAASGFGSAALGAAAGLLGRRSLRPVRPERESASVASAQVD